MTPQEALDILYKGIAPNPTANNECIKLCKKALEKQIPKKVNNLEVFSDIGACVPKTKSGNCPVCNNFMIGKHTYCNDCGQALDWGDNK